MWLDIVLDYSPTDIIAPVQVYTEGGRKSVKLLFRKKAQGYEYTIPLNRNLLVEEAETVVDAWDAYYSGEFEIESSTTEFSSGGVDYDFDEVEDEPLEDYELFAEELAKLNHKHYIKRLQNDGWRYGTTFSSTDKTTPIMLPWEQLGEKFKIIDLDYAGELLELIEKMGFTIEEK